LDLLRARRRDRGDPVPARWKVRGLQAQPLEELADLDRPALDAESHSISAAAWAVVSGSLFKRRLSPTTSRPQQPFHAAVFRRGEGCDANQTSGSSTSSCPGGMHGSRLRASRRYAKGSMSWCLQVPTKEYKMAAVRPQGSLPRNVQFLRPSAW